MNEKLKLVRTRRINNILLEYYIDQERELWITGEQLGKFLGYVRPRNAIAVLHGKHADRLDQYCKRVNITEDEEALVYSFKGLLEVCRHSRKPNANMILDSLFELVEEIERSKQS